MAISEELQAEIAEAVRIVAEDRLYKALQGRLTPPADPEPPNPDEPGPPPAKVDDPAPEPKAKKGLWWQEVDDVVVEPAPDGS